MMSDKKSFTYKTSFNLNRIEIYVTHFQFSFQCFDIYFKYIIINVMLEILSWKSITATFSYCIVQKLIKSVFEMKSYFLEMFSDSNLQHIETEFNEIEVQRVWWQILYLTLMWNNKFLNTSITMYADVIHDDDTLWDRKETA